MLVQDRCTVCANIPLVQKIILEAPDGTPVDEDQVEARFGLFGYRANLDAR